jgi:hypothetical protein
VSGLFQALLGQAAKLPQPRLDERKQALSLINVDTVRRYVSLLVDNRSMVTLHLSVGFEAVGPDLSQRLGEVFSFLNWTGVSSPRLRSWVVFLLDSM